MTICYIGIGSNIGDRQSYIDKALKKLGSKKDIKISRASSIYETEPVGDIPQGKYLNGVIEIETGLSPRDLLNNLLAVEQSLGRTRTARNAPRTIDLDILYYGEKMVREDGLVIPHPRISEREFVLRGLRELGKIDTK